MEFCPECGTRLVLRLEEPSNDVNKVVLICSNCNYKKSEMVIEQKVFKTAESYPQEDILVISEEEAKIHTMPTTKIECPKCANNLAYWWMIQTRGADESSTQFFRCTKCNYTWREMA